MSVRFKFRSSVGYDSVDIGARSSISIRDLKSMIVRRKNLSICQDFDLVFYDHLTGEDYNDENIQIPSGSSVIIRRVPVGSQPLVMAQLGSVKKLESKDTNTVDTSLPMKVDIENFEDFGIDLCPVNEDSLFGSDLVIDNTLCVGGKKGKENIDVPRCYEPPKVGCQKLEASDLSDAISRGPTHGVELKPTVGVQMKMGKLVDAHYPAIQNAEFPSELKCSICDTFFKEAVMIPCCQHSFCEACIGSMLIQKARCPKCFSTKCSIKDLLPNLSLRQAIEHFLESKNLDAASDNALHQYAPDEESAIEAKDVSRNVSVFRREIELLHSPSATGRGSNQFMVKTTYDSLYRDDVTEHHEMKEQMGGQRHGSIHPANFRSDPEDLGSFTDFQGESQPIIGEGGEKNCFETGRHKKGNRTCYMCGSPDHMIRDCPAARSTHPMFQRENAFFPGSMPGYDLPYWSGTPLHHFRPIPNLCGNAGMMPFNPTMIPATPFNLPTYVPSVYGSLPALPGYMRVGGMTSLAGRSAEPHMNHYEYLQQHEKGWKPSNDNLRREQSCDDDDGYYNKTYHYAEMGRPHDHKSRVEREKTVSYSSDSLNQKSKRKHQRNVHLVDRIQSADERSRRQYYHSERSSSEVEDKPSTSSYHSEERNRRHHRISNRHNERKEPCSDSGRSHSQTYKEKDSKKRDVKMHNYKHQSRSVSGSKPRFPSDKLKQQKEKDSSRGSKPSRHDMKPMNNHSSHERLQISGSEDGCREDYWYHKRKRVH